MRKVFHGKHELNSAEKKAIYGSHVLSFTESNYVNIDTIFLLIDALLFTSLVDLKDSNPSLINKTYEEMYKDVRTSVDLCHRDGVIKDAVIRDPAKHIIYDKGMVPMLKRLKEAGKKVRNVLFPGDISQVPNFSRTCVCIFSPHPHGLIDYNNLSPRIVLYRSLSLLTPYTAADLTVSPLLSIRCSC